MRPEVIAEFVSKFGRAVEVCVGYYSKVAEILMKKNLLLCVCDSNPILKEYYCKKGIIFIECDVRKPSEELIKFCTRASVIYAIRPPPEIWNDVFALAKICNCRCVVRPMSSDCYGKKIVYAGEIFLVQ